MNTAKRIYVVGTCDTKGAELNYAADLIAMAGANCVVVDVSTSSGKFAADVSAAHVANFHPGGVSAVLGLDDRGKAVTAMAEAFAHFILSQNDVGAVLGMGGSGNSTIVTAGMRALPIGVPKLMVSTLASGNVASFVGASDIAMMHSVADVAGLNAISRQVIGNAAHAVVGMVLNAVPQELDTKLPVGITMFGVTTECVSKVRQAIDERCESFVFHATGTGGQCMEKLVDSGYLKALIDVTTTEVADHLFGGILPCTDDRFGSVIRTKVPYVGSVGAVDMVNFGPRESVPQNYASRKFHVHNSSVTLMRTTPQENAVIGTWIVNRLNQMTGPVRFLLPLRGVSAIDAEGQIFADSLADQALFSAIRAGWKSAPNRRLVEVDAHINSAAFADAVVHSFQEIA
ncbi:MAG: Tm-1-like ATP-binding domain-containing protein [Aestuariivirga sp.]